MHIAALIANNAQSLQPGLDGKAYATRPEQSLSTDYKILRSCVGLETSQYSNILAGLAAALYARPHYLRMVVPSALPPELAALDVPAWPLPFDYADFWSKLKADSRFNDLCIKHDRHAELYSIVDAITFAAAISSWLVKLRNT